MEEDKNMLRFVAMVGVVVAVASVCPAAPWISTFDTDADGVVDIFNNNPGKAMIGPVTSGRLQIESWDNTTGIRVSRNLSRFLSS